MKKLIALIIAVFALAIAPFVLMAASPTLVPGHAQDRYDKDNNGITDAGVYVNGHYDSLYAYDAYGDFYWDLGDGRIIATVGSIDQLDEATLTICEYNSKYRADFGNTPYMDHGWIQQTIVCRGYDYPTTAVYMYLIVSDSDPRYTGDPAKSIWGTWEYHVLAESGSGNYFVHLAHDAIVASGLLP